MTTCELRKVVVLICDHRQQHLNSFQDLDRCLGQQGTAKDKKPGILIETRR